MADLYEAIEPALSFAQQELGDVDSAENPSTVERARAAVGTCRRFIELHCVSKRETYDMAARLEALARSLSGGPYEVEREAIGACTGDAEQVAFLVETLVRSVELEPDSVLVVELFEEEDTPHVTLALDGPGRFPDPVPFGFDVVMPMAALRERWTAATHGGRMDDTANGLALRLKGVRMAPEPIAGVEPLWERVREADRRVRLLEAARDEGSETAGAARVAREAIGEALAYGDALEYRGCGTGVSQSDLGKVLSEVILGCRQSMETAALSVEHLVDPDLPSIAVHRPRMSGFFRQALRFGEDVLHHGGSVSVLLGYEPAQRDASIVVVVAGSRDSEGGACPIASMRRAIVDVHGGRFEVAFERKEVTITAGVPDTIGRALDEWVPGWGAFSALSQRMLRLLKSGEEAVPEDAILDGVLRTELEGWLLPKLAEAPAVNLAHELGAADPHLPEGSPERLAKGLSQIRRGKPKKEIVHPPYAGDILWAFRVDERHRHAVGCDSLDEHELRDLCSALLATPTDSVTCLRLLAKAQAG